MVALTDIEPSPISSVLQRNEGADAPPWIAGSLVAFPALFVSSPLNFLFIGLGIVTGFATEIVLSHLRAKWRIADATTPPADYPKPVDFDPVRRAEEWQKLTTGPDVRSLVFFSYGTCVVIIDEAEDPTELAKQLLSEFGHAIPGTSSADMLVYALPDSGDFVIGCHHPNILTYVPRSLFDVAATNDQLRAPAAFLGRDFRCLDAFAQQTVHVKRVADSQNGPI